MTTEISSANRIIAAVGEHVIAQDTLAGGDEGIGVDKSAVCGIVITGLQIIEPGILGGVLAIRSIFARLPLVLKPQNQRVLCTVIARGSRGYLSCGYAS